MNKSQFTTAPRTEAVHREGSYVMRLSARPDEIFPLLCPVREYDWIAPWTCELLHSLSGAAERGCVFRTNFHDCGEETWLCTRFEPPRAIEYVRFATIGLITHLSIALAADGKGGSNVLWHLGSTATTEAGEKHLAGFSVSRYEQDMAGFEHMLRHYLETGTTLRT